MKVTRISIEFYHTMMAFEEIRKHLHEGKSAVVSWGKKGANGEKATFFLVNRRTVLLLAALAANIDSGR